MTVYLCCLFRHCDDQKIMEDCCECAAPKRLSKYTTEDTSNNKTVSHIMGSVKKGEKYEGYYYLKYF